MQSSDYKLKLAHSHGGITCDGDFVYAPFGCVTRKKPTISKLRIVITDDQNKKLLPGRKGYTHDGKDGSSMYILFKNTVNLQRGQQLRLWYEEDFKDEMTHDNFGMSCAYVLARKED